MPARHRLQSRLLTTVFLLCALPVSAHTGVVAQAIPMSQIHIDGRLDDWPDRMVVYPILSVHPNKHDPPYAGADLTASFRVGYDTTAGEFYVAVIIVDDDVVTRQSLSAMQDRCEIFVEVEHKEQDVPDHRARIQQLLMVPGPGRGVQTINGQAVYGIRAAFHRIAGRIVYEWAIPLKAQGEGERPTIHPGSSIGFDVAVSDADGMTAANWISWTPGLDKSRRSDRLGHLQLLARAVEAAGDAESVLRRPDADVAEEAGIGTLVGIVTDAQTGQPISTALLHDSPRTHFPHSRSPSRHSLR